MNAPETLSAKVWEARVDRRWAGYPSGKTSPDKGDRAWIPVAVLLGLSMLSTPARGEEIELTLPSLQNICSTDSCKPNLPEVEVEGPNENTADTEDTIRKS